MTMFDDNFIRVDEVDFGHSGYGGWFMVHRNPACSDDKTICLQEEEHTDGLFICNATNHPNVILCVECLAEVMTTIFPIAKEIINGEKDTTV